MRTRPLVTLLMVSVVALLAALWTTAIQHSSEDTTTQLNRPLFPELKPDINQVKSFRVIKAGKQTVATLQRGEQTWTVAERNNYPADMGKVRGLLLGLANAVLLEEKTADPKLYDYLGVEDIGQANASGVRVEIDGLAHPLALIIGNHDNQTGNGTFVRVADQAQSWLISAFLTVAKQTPEWLDPAITDIPVGQVQQVTIRHSDGEILSLIKDDRDQPNFILDLPPDRTLQSDSIANPLGGVLAGLRLEDVVPLSQLDPTAHPGVQAEYRTFDGMIITVKAFAQDDKRYAHLAVGFDADQAQRFLPPDVALTDSELAERRQRAEQLHNRLNPWVYQIPALKYDLLNKRADDLFKPLKDQQPDGETSQQETPGAESEPAPADAIDDGKGAPPQ